MKDRNSQKEGAQQSYGESISCYSLTDSEVMRCNHRIRNCENSDLGRRIWDSISNLGVVGTEEIGVSVKLVEALERKDKEVIEDNKESKIQF